MSFLRYVADISLYTCCTTISKTARYARSATTKDSTADGGLFETPRKRRSTKGVPRSSPGNFKGHWIQTGPPLLLITAVPWLLPHIIVIFVQLRPSSLLRSLLLLCLWTVMIVLVIATRAATTSIVR